jgi:hypothetical protein
VKLCVVGLDVDHLLAGWAVHEVPGDTWRRPAAKHPFFDALDVEDVLAAKDDWWLVTKAWDHANAAVILLWVVLVELEVHVLLVVLPDAVFVKAG